MQNECKTDSQKWEEKCAVIKQRDGHTCQMCGDKESKKMRFNVHHKHYFLGRKKWEYEDDVLETLCWNCHFYKTNFEGVPVYDADGNFIANSDECYRCKGTGRIKKYSHHMGGICFKCKGVGYDQKIPLRVIYNHEEIEKLKAFFEERKKK